MDLSEQNRLIARFRAARRDNELALLEGFHALKHAIRFQADIRSVITHDSGGLALLAQQLGPDVGNAMTRELSQVPKELFQQLAPGEHETGVISIAKRPVVTREELEALPMTAPVVLLEAPTHLGNVGAAVRVAAAAGAAALLTTGQLDPWHPHAIRGSAGLHFAIPVTRVENYALPGRPLIAIDPDGESLDVAAIPSNAVLAFGTERAGISDALLKRADARIRIPMEAAVSSLNLATSVAVILYAWRLRRTAQ